MHIIKIGNAYVTAGGNLTIVQADALRVDIPAGHHGQPTPRLVRFKTRLDRMHAGQQRDARAQCVQNAPVDGSPTPLDQCFDRQYNDYGDSGDF